MSQPPLLECVPNFSEGRNERVLLTIRTAIENVQGVKLINVHADGDHNRSVFTILGSPAPLKEAAFQATRTAASLIDLRNHEGRHPRIGATDVIPFIPVRNANMQDAVNLAIETGFRIATELLIPVYLYGQAARNPFHRKLVNLRRSGYENLQYRIDTEPDMLPDFGPVQVGTAGATVVGARDYLIAFNIFLKSDDLTLSKRIAKQVRESSGGLQGVQALGMIVKNMAQVSMNLTDFKKTSLMTLFEAVKTAAEQHNTAVNYSELVGCLPQAAIKNIDVEALQLIDFSPGRILETHFSTFDCVKG